MVDWTAMSFMGFYAVFIFPATYVADKCGLRWTAIIGSGLCCLGAWIKIFSVQSDRFYIVLIGQSTIAIAQVILEFLLYSTSMSRFVPPDPPCRHCCPVVPAVITLYPAPDSDLTDARTLGRAVVSCQATLDRHVSGYFWQSSGNSVGLPSHVCNSEEPRESG